MKNVYLHLVLSHIPVVGILFTLIVLIAAGLLKNNVLKTAALAGIMLIAIAAVAVYYSGENAEEAVEHMPWASEELIGQHEEWAAAAVISSAVLGIAALAGIIITGISKPFPGWMLWVVFICTVITAGLLARTANTGGQIRHAEIRTNFQLPGNSGSENFSGYNQHREPGRHHDD